MKVKKNIVQIMNNVKIMNNERKIMNKQRPSQIEYTIKL